MDRIREILEFKDEKTRKEYVESLSCYWKARRDELEENMEFVLKAFECILHGFDLYNHMVDGGDKCMSEETRTKLYAGTTKVDDLHFLATVHVRDTLGLGHYDNELWNYELFERDVGRHVFGGDFGPDPSEDSLLYCSDVKVLVLT
jgi:hypothetical protein